MTRRLPALLMVAVLAALPGCGHNGPATGNARTSHPLVANFQAVKGDSMDAEVSRLKLLKTMTDQGDAGLDAFVAKTLAPFDTREEVPANLPKTPLRMSIASEFCDLDMVRQTLPALKAKNISVFLALPPERLEDARYVAVLKEAQAIGAEVNPWMLVKQEDGYWFSKWNHKLAADYVRKAVAKLTAAGVKPTGIALDMETPVTVSLPILDALKRFELVKAYRLLLAASKEGSMAETRQTLRELVADMHAQGIKVYATTMPFVLDDMVVGKGQIQKAFGIPFEGIDWDGASFMCYRPEFYGVVGKFGSDFVYRYALDAKRFYGTRACIDIGEVGNMWAPPNFPLPPVGFTDPADLKSDMQALQAAGLSQGDVYSLEGVLQMGGLDRWLTIPQAAPVKREVKPLLLRAIFQTLARMLPADDKRERGQ